LVFDDQDHRQDLIDIEQDRTGRRGFPRGEREAAPEKNENSEDRELLGRDKGLGRQAAATLKAHVLKAHVLR
jgi:hypothetical protein